ncbi:hypothetical protein AMK23_24150 [Streptomyces sp. CB02130]|nr:hypothetical protein AMK23_24150 [Streptomyces sp. CB02130]
MEDSRRHPGKRMPATGTTGTVGTTAVRALATDQHFGSVLGPALRQPDLLTDRSARYRAGSPYRGCR